MPPDRPPILTMEDRAFPTDEELGAILRAKIAPLRVRLADVEAERAALWYEMAALRSGAHGLDRKGWHDEDIE